MYYRINPVDSWFFRNATPFDAGINTYGDSIFPPFPSVYAGALRNCAAPIINSERTKNTFSRALKIGWNGIMINQHLLFPVPLDLHIATGENGHLIATEQTLASSGGSSFPLPCFLTSSNGQGKPPHIRGSAYLDETDMGAYLHAESKEYLLHQSDDYFRKETRVGIKIDSPTGIATEGQFYQQSFVTPMPLTPKDKAQQCSLAIEASGIEAPKQSIVRMGGESKLAVISQINETLPLPDPVETGDQSCFKLYLATPAIFEKGWLPGWIHPKTMTCVFTHKKHSIRARLLSAAVGKPIAIGGFGLEPDKHKPYPKEMRYAVPAGSVYFFKLLNGSMTDVIRLFHKKCLSDYRETLGFHSKNLDRLRYCSRGFGYSLVGLIGKNQKGEIKDV